MTFNVKVKCHCWLTQQWLILQSPVTHVFSAGEGPDLNHVSGVHARANFSTSGCWLFNAIGAIPFEGVDNRSRPIGPDYTHLLDRFGFSQPEGDRQFHL